MSLTTTACDLACQGFVEMVPPLRLPRRAAGQRVAVWLRLPEQAEIWRDSGGTFRLPLGTRVMRVEALIGKQRGSRILDVRGTDLDDDGQRFFVLKPVGRGNDLRGWSWRRSSPEEQSLATELIANFVAASVAPGARADALATAQRTNACTGCHALRRPENLRPGQYGLANRRTDADGFFQIQSEFTNEQPIETYFALDSNLDYPFIELRCGNERASVAEGRVYCKSGAVPRGQLDVRAAVTARDEHALAVCRSRAYLFAHLERVAQSEVQGSLDECRGAIR